MTMSSSILPKNEYSFPQNTFSDCIIVFIQKFRARWSVTLQGFPDM